MHIGAWRCPLHGVPGDRTSSRGIHLLNIWTSDLQGLQMSFQLEKKPKPNPIVQASLFKVLKAPVGQWITQTRKCQACFSNRS